MKKLLYAIFVLFVMTVIIPGLVTGAIDIDDTKFLTQPAISRDHIAFVYAGDLWVADTDGNNVRRLTSDDGIESSPVFSPNGKLIAFSAEYDGNTDVFIIPVEGGMPKRLTWHPGFDIVRGFTPDGSSVLFISQRNVFTNRYTQLFTVPIDGGFPEALKIPNAFKAAYSPDGKRMAYNPLSEAFRQWKNYRGGTVSTIWLYTFSDHSVVKIPQPEGRCNDIDAMWIGDKIYFLSDRNGEFNLFHYDVTSKEIKQLTSFTDFPIIDASAGDNKIVFEQGGHLHIFDLATNKSQKLTIGIATDLAELRPRYVKGGSRYVRSAGISPSGVRAVFDFRGEIITVPEEKGDPRNLTNSPGTHERFPAWSPDGKTIAYFSDESGEYKIHLQSQDGKGAEQKFKLNGSGFYSTIEWSPDSKKLTFTDNARNLYWLDIAKGSIKKIATEPIYHPGAFGSIRGVWSPDSKWIVYTLNTPAYIEQVHLYSIDQDKSFPVTDGLSNASDPVFDKSGKYLYFFASTDAGPVKHWFAMSSADMRMTRAIYLVTLQKDVPSPLAKESDEEKGAEKKEAAEKDEKSKKDESKKEPDKAETPFVIDFEGLKNRIISLPVDEGNYFSLQVGDEGKIYYLEAPGTARGSFAKGTKLHFYDLEKRKDEVIISEVNNYQISQDKKKILYQEGESWKIVPISGKGEPGKGNLNINSIQVRINPPAEWKQIFDEAWRINRDYFYATNMHGVDWNAMYKKYRPFLAHASCRNDVNRLIQWMCSELAVGHHRVGGGDFLSSPDRVPGGLLGADYAIENGRYRFKKIYGGLNWNPELRSPLTEPGVDVRVGDYLLAVNGTELTSAQNLYSLFENTSGKIVEITVGANPNMTGSRTFNVVPIANESMLRNRDWVEDNLKKVDDATNGRVAYVYVPNTTTLGHTYFKRYFYPQVHKEAIIVDERFNGGGLLADYYIDHLRRPFLCNWNMRYGDDIKTPSASIQGPKVMLIDETAGSGGDFLPWMFRELNMGKLIGKRTWGGLVGTLGFPTLMDGAYVSAPNLAIWTEEGWIVENVGVPPDIEVEQLPAEVISGKDPQLEKAIEVIMQELKKDPPKKMKRPPYPVRARQN